MIIIIISNKIWLLNYLLHIVKYIKKKQFFSNNYSDINDIIGKFNLLRPSSSNFSINTNPCTISPPAFSINFEAASNVPIKNQNAFN